jgi:hypothetical protein
MTLNIGPWRIMILKRVDTARYMENARKSDMCCVPGCGGDNFPYCRRHDAP